MSMAQSSTSGPVNARRLRVPFRKQTQEDVTPVGNHGSKNLHVQKMRQKDVASWRSGP